MPEIIDILTQPETESAYFDVDTALADVPIVTQDGFVVPAIDNVLGRRAFNWRDNFIILSCGVSLPAGFSFSEFAGQVRPYVLLAYSWASDLGTKYLIGSASDSLLYLPLPDYEFSLGTYVDVGSFNGGGNPGENFVLSCGLSGNERISMVGVPAAYQGLRFYVPTFLKILHNLPMRLP